MSDSHIKNLKKAGSEIALSQTPEEKLQSLTQAFELFSKETNRLSLAYDDLNEQFQSVHSELEVTNQKLTNKIFEFHVMMNYLTSILNNMSQGILFIGSEEGLITTINPLAEKMLNIEGKDTLFKHFWDVFPDQFFGFSMKEALALNRAPERNFITIDIENKPNRELEINTSFVKGNTALVQSKEDISLDFTKGMIVLIRDITEIRRLQQTASRNDRMKELGEMAAMVAHEIRNPLGGIKGFASLLVRDLKDQPKLQQMANYIVTGTDSLNRLVTDILNYSRPIQLKFEQLDIISVIKELREHVLVDSNLNNKLEIHIEITQKTIFVLIDQQQFKSAFLNLIVNAIQAMPSGGLITINVKTKSKDAFITVKDTGVGIPPENLEKIFSPFFTTKSQGHGFGLTEAHKIIQAHQGTLEVSSEIGKGTEFTIKLPLTL